MSFVELGADDPRDIGANFDTFLDEKDHAVAAILALKESQLVDHVFTCANSTVGLIRENIPEDSDCFLDAYTPCTLTIDRLGRT
jgi:hypothetical protein